jgi:hypothetical protein
MCDLGKFFGGVGQVGFSVFSRKREKGKFPELLRQTIGRHTESASAPVDTIPLDEE